MVRGDLGMSGSAFLVLAAAVFAGFFLRVWAFALATLVVMATWVTFLLMRGETFATTAVNALTLLALMQLAYFVGLLIAQLLLPRLRRRRAAETTTAPIGGEPPSV